MPPHIASLIFGVFIAMLFIIDSRRKPNVSFSHWIPFLWLLILASRPIGAWLQPSGMGEANPDLTLSEGSEIDRNVLISLMTAGLVVLFRRTKKVAQFLRDNKWLILLVAYCGISVLWSDYPSIALKRWFRGLGSFIMAVVVLTEDDPLETVRTMLRRSAFLLAPLSVLLIKYYREYGVFHGEFGGASYCGVTAGKNALGRLCLILGFYFIWEILHDWKNKGQQHAGSHQANWIVNLTNLVVIAWLLVTAHSATSTACLAVATLMLLVLHVPALRRDISQLNAILLTSATGALVLVLVTDIESAILSLLGRDATLTGRTELWSMSLTFVGNHLVGVGYESYWLGERLQVFWSRYWWHPTQVHNGYLDIYLSLGIIGLFLLFGVLVSSYNKTKRSLSNDFYVGTLQLPLFIAYLAYNVTENAFGMSSLYWFVFLIVVLLQHLASPEFQTTGRKT